MIPLRCNVYDCYAMPMLDYTINKKKVYRCNNHPIKCHNKKCSKKPTISFKHNDKLIFYCTKHGKMNQINICKNYTCNSIATYGPKDTQTPLLCIKHKTYNMEILIKQCSYFGCQKKPTHNYLTLFKESNNINIKLKGIYCDTHKQPKMISIDDFNKGFTIKTINDNNDNLDVNKQDIIQYETNENKTENKNYFNVIYEMRNDANIYLRSILNDYIII